MLRSLFNWSIRVGYVDRTPFKRQTETVVKLAQELPRHRRLEADEETKLLANAGAHLHGVIVAALETGMRRGEMLSLQWAQVEGLKVNGVTLTWAPRAELFLPAGKTKTKRDRRIPISSRLKAVLDMRRNDPAGQPLPADAYVFGNAIGQQVQNFKRAWNTAVLKAHGHEPTYTESANLTTESRAALDVIDLHFHDLQREAGSRWMDAGVPLATIQRWLGHTNISQTSTYLAGTSASEHDAMRQFEERRAALQPFATDAGTGGRKRPQAATGQNRKPNKTAVGRESAIM